MKLITKFSEFLNDSVNLNQTRIDTLESRTTTIKSFLEASSYEPDIIEFSTQGSWAHKTIIKPVKAANEFDADMVIYVDEVKGWSAKDYIEELYKIFRDNGTYRSMVSRKSRCVTLNYAGDFHLDLVPVTVRGGFLGLTDQTYRVCNRHSDDFELTDGDAFKDWWKEKDRIVSNHRLLKTARLIKFLRDTKTTFSCKSVLLTTLIGNMVDDDEVPLFGKTIEKGFEDVPTTLKTIMGRLDDYLQGEPEMPEILNPALDEESFTRNWSDDQYKNFRKKIHQYREWVDDAYGEANRNESIRKWRRLFGEGFAQDVAISEAKTSVMATYLAEQATNSDEISLIRRLGTQILSHIPRNLTHVQLPRLKETNTLTVKVSAWRKPRRNGARGASITSGEILPKNSGVEFQALNNMGIPFDRAAYKVRWLVVNTGDEASSARGLRGGFNNSQTHGCRWEATQYRGVHWVEAIVINKRRNIIEGRSARFFVPIE